MPSRQRAHQNRVPQHEEDRRDGHQQEHPLAHRLALADRELEAIRFFDYAVVNDEVEVAAATVLEIIAAEREGRRAELLARHGRKSVFSSWKKATRS